MTAHVPPVEELKPCPFCGWEADIIGQEGNGFCVSCKNAACYGSLGFNSADDQGHYFKSGHEARYFWNRRAP